MCGNVEDLLLMLGSTAGLTGLLAAGQYTVDRVRRSLQGAPSDGTVSDDADGRAADLSRLVQVVFTETSTSDAPQPFPSAPPARE